MTDETITEPVFIALAVEFPDSLEGLSVTFFILNRVFLLRVATQKVDLE